MPRAVYSGFDQPSAHHRLAGAATAVAVTGLLMAMLQPRPAVQAAGAEVFRAPKAPPVAYLRLLPDPPVARAPTMPHQGHQRHQPRRAAPAVPPMNAPLSITVLDPPQPAVPPEAAASPAQVASPGLDLGPAVMRQAVAQSKGTVRRLADASGAYTGDRELGPAERLAKDTERAGKPDCLRQGGSLLSAVVILYERAADKCSTR